MRSLGYHGWLKVIDNLQRLIWEIGCINVKMGKNIDFICVLIYAYIIENNKERNSILILKASVVSCICDCVLMVRGKFRMKA